MRRNDDDDPRFSWICRDEFERARFLDLNGRLLRANMRILLALGAALAIGIPFLQSPLSLIPAAIGMAVFGGVQRSAARFARPELWVFAALLGAEAVIVLAIAMNDSAVSPAMALLCWPVAGVAARFPLRASRVGTVYAAALAVVAILVSDPGVLTADPLALTLLLLAIASVHTVARVLRDSDVEHRAAAIIDPLTGMLNRTALINRTLEIEHQSRLTGETVSVIVADLDRFKRVNDNHGHPTGDLVLKEVADRMRDELRAYDLAYRLSGEEFVILLLGGTPHATTTRAEKVRAAIADKPILGLHITASLGVATSMRGSSFVWEDVFARADAALFRAKAGGRDRVTTATAA